MHSLHLVLALFGQAAITAAVPLQPLEVVEIAKRAPGDLDVIEKALAPVSDSLTNLDNAILALDGGPVTANNLLVVSQQTQVVTDQATANIQSANDLGPFRAARLRRTTDGLIDQTTTTVNDLVSRKPILDNLGVSGVALETLQRQKISTMALTAAVEEKVPRVGQRIASEGRSQIESVLDQGIAIYSVPAAAAVPITAPAPPAVAAPAPPAAAPAPPAAVPAPPAAAPVPAAGISNPNGIPLAAPAPPRAAPVPPPAAAPAPVPAAPIPPAVPAVGAPLPPPPAVGAPPAAPAPVPAPAPNVPAAPQPIPAPPPQITAPAGRKDRKKKKKVLRRA